MRSLLFTLLLLSLESTVFACVCSMHEDESLSQTVSRYDFIAHVKINSVRTHSFTDTLNDGMNDFAQLEIIDLLKGKHVDSIHVWGIGSSCDMGMKNGDEWVLFGSSAAGGYTTHSCTRSYRLQSYEKDRPFFTTMLYDLKKFFGHPLPVLKNGTKEVFFSNKKLKTRYTVKDGKLDGEYWYMTDKAEIYYFNFRNGEKEGTSYHLGPKGRWLSVYLYSKGELTEMIQYDSDRAIEPEFANRQQIDSFVARQKTISYHKIYLPDRSILVKSWNDKGIISSIVHKDPTGRALFQTRYFETGMIEGSRVFDRNTGIDVYTGYYDNGVVERKMTTYPDKKNITIFYNRDGSLKQEVIRQDNKTISTKDY